MDTVFSDSEFNLPLYFIEAVFEGDAMFNSAKFNADVRFFSTQFKGGAFFDSTEFNGDAVKCLGQLKRLTDAYGQVDQALNFNAMELRAMRMQTTPKPKALSFKVVTWLYEKVSDYGRSFAKPLFWYGILICLSALLSIIYSKYSEKPIEEQQLLCKPLDGQPPPLKLSYERAVFEYAMFRAGGLMDFTDTGKQNNAVNCRLFDEPIEPGLMRAWGVFKGIASIALLFLAALGLRNKYRIK